MSWHETYRFSVVSAQALYLGFRAEGPSYTSPGRTGAPGERSLLDRGGEGLGQIVSGNQRAESPTYLCQPDPQAVFRRCTRLPALRFVSESEAFRRDKS